MSIIVNNSAKNKDNNSKKTVTFKDLMDSTDEELSTNKNPPSKMYESFIKDAYSSAHRQARRTNAEAELKVMEPPRDYEIREIRPKANKYYDEPESYYKPLSSPTSTSSTTSTASASSTISTKSRLPPGAVRSTLSAPNVLYGNRRYYSRYSDDPDYFDYDLNHSVDLFRKTKSSYVPLSTARTWESNLFKGKSHTTGDSAISSHMFQTTGTNKYEDSRYQNSSYISAALRTPTYWAYRYQNFSTNPPKP